MISAWRGRNLCSIVTLLLGVVVWTTTAGADYERPVPGVPDAHGILYDTPVYNPTSRSYFALIWAHSRKDNYHGTNWETANVEARAREYKGVHGRLAMVDSFELHEFLLRTFHPDVEVWIGLKYLCQAKALQWASGQLWKPGFQAWDQNWRQDVYACASAGDKDKDFMPIAYSPVDRGFRWIGKGKQKEFFGYFIEFPTGGP